MQSKLDGTLLCACVHWQKAGGRTRSDVSSNNHMRGRRSVCSCVKICLVVLALAAFRGDAGAQETRTPDHSPALEKCLSSRPAATPENDVISVPIERLFVDGRTMSVSEMLCIVIG